MVTIPVDQKGEPQGLGLRQVSNRSRCAHLAILSILSQIFSSHYHSFPLVSKHQEN